MWWTYEMRVGELRQFKLVWTLSFRASNSSTVGYLTEEPEVFDKTKLRKLHAHIKVYYVLSPRIALYCVFLQAASNTRSYGQIHCSVDLADDAAT